MNNAQKDITFQVPVELQIAWLLAREFSGHIRPNPKGKDSAKDFQLWIPWGIEVKCDLKSKLTHNLFFEVYNPYRKEQSGLTATKAHLWVHYIPGIAMAYRYRPGAMLAWLKEREAAQDKNVLFLKNCGDNNSDGYVVSVKVIAALPFVKSMPLML